MGAEEMDMDRGAGVSGGRDWRAQTLQEESSWTS